MLYTYTCVDNGPPTNVVGVKYGPLAMRLKPRLKVRAS